MTQNMGDFQFRSVHPNDRDEMKALHEEFFPIRYNDSFYNEMVQGIGMHGGKLLSIVAEDRATGRIAGFALFQMLKYPDQAEDSNLFTYPYPQYGCYILTLGVAPAYRMHGLASTLLSKCKDVAASEPKCGALYLHVIHYNSAAIKLYTKNQFQFLRNIPDFYYFNETYFPAYLFAFYVNNHHAPGTSSGAESFFGAVSDWTTKSWEIVSEAVTQVLFTSTVSIADATRWIYQQFSPEVMAVSVAQISHHWSPTTAVLLPGAEISIEVASNSKIYPADEGPSVVADDSRALASPPADGEMRV